MPVKLGFIFNFLYSSVNDYQSSLKLSFFFGRSKLSSYHYDMSKPYQGSSKYALPIS